MSDEDAAEVVLTPHRWWDRRMGLLANLSFGFVRPLVCLLRGHRFDDWWTVVDDDDHTIEVGEFACCRTCARTADREVFGRDAS